MEDEEETIMNIYRCARKIALERGYGDDIDNLRKLINDPPYKKMTRDEFYQNYVWVVFTCGFKARTVKMHWDEIKKMTEGFSVFETSQKTKEILMDESPIKNEGKLKGLIDATKIITDGWLESLRKMDSEGEIKTELMKLPYIGNVTVNHLMRNIGIDVFKPDRHIVNLANELDISPSKMFEIISTHSNESLIGIIDYILWKGCESLGSANMLIKCAEKGISVDLPPKEEGTDDFLY